MCIVYKCVGGRRDVQKRVGVRMDVQRRVGMCRSMLRCVWMCISVQGCVGMCRNVQTCVMVNIVVQGCVEMRKCVQDICISQVPCQVSNSCSRKRVCLCVCVQATYNSSRVSERWSSADPESNLKMYGLSSGYCIVVQTNIRFCN